MAELRLEPMRGEGSVFRSMGTGTDVVSPAANENFHHSEDPTLYVQRAYEDILRALTTGASSRIDAARPCAVWKLWSLFTNPRAYCDTGEETWIVLKNKEVSDGLTTKP